MGWARRLKSVEEPTGSKEAAKRRTVRTGRWPRRLVMILSFPFGYMKPVLIFDLDGTLVDSKKDLTASVNYIRHQFDLPSLNEDEIARFIGDGALMLIRRALAEKATESSVQYGLQMFLSY